MAADSTGSPAGGPGTLAGKIFAAPFVLGGVLALAVAATQGGSRPWRDTVLLAIAGTVFTGVGVAIAVATAAGSRLLARTTALRQQHPDAPWLWRDDWASGRIGGATKSRMLQAWGFAALCNLLSAPMLFAGIPARMQRDPAVAIALAFPALGLGLLLWAVRETLEWRKFGASAFEMAAVPGSVGGTLAGRIQTRLARAPSTGATVRLTSYRRTVTGGGKNQTVTEHILWREEQVVAPSTFEAGPAGLAIPVEVRIPPDARETDESNPRDSYRWRLDVAAAIPGLDYTESFEVPVFRTSTCPAREQPAETRCAPERPQPLNPTVLVRPSAGGGLELRFPAARNPGAAVGLTGFCLLWSGVVWFLVTHAAPLLFVVTFGLFDAFLVTMVLTLWLGTSRVVVEAGSVTVRTAILGIGVRRRFPSSEVVAVELPIGMQSGDGSGTPYYDLRLVLQSRSLVVVGRGVRSKHEAEWLAGELRRALGLLP